MKTLFKHLSNIFHYLSFLFLLGILAAIYSIFDYSDDGFILGLYSIFGFTLFQAFRKICSTISQYNRQKLLDSIAIFIASFAILFGIGFGSLFTAPHWTQESLFMLGAIMTSTILLMGIYMAVERQIIK